ncbi:ADP-ribosylglycohydrolase family protein [Mycolicibacterium litorale]|uniref:ADP-ribosylglycohydrolase family protein n=1 Tax=Mycolicibacterium litorale TaxID=758802 RepID=UPI003CF40380
MDTTPIRSRIRAGLLAYAAGDAAGVPWEGCRAAEVHRLDIDELPRRGDWPPGATSDDTALTLLVAEYLRDRGAVVDEAEFLTRLAAAAPGIRGIGPSTRAAVDRFRTSGAVRADSGDTNGAAMRALPIGWAVADADVRRTVTAGLSRTTHGAAPAVAAACIAAAMASAALDGESPVAAGRSETDWAESEFGIDLTPVRRAGEGGWWPHRNGVTLYAVDTMAAVVGVIRHATDQRAGVADALRHAVSLGGDTDTVAAIVGGILGGREPRTPDIPWLTRVDLPDTALLDDVCAALAALRASTD